MPEQIKCVVWDLDNTIWDGVCLEGDVCLRESVRQTIITLDSRGILHSIASRGEESVSLAVLKSFSLDSYFLVPRINWQQKPANINAISRDLGIGLDAIAFIDDDAFEREQVSFMIPDVLTLGAEKAVLLPRMPAFSPGVLTPEARARRQFYQSEQQRKQNESSYPTREAFLTSCQMCLVVRPLREADIPRVLELMTRTHQLNTSGRIFSETELLHFLTDHSGTWSINVADLSDRFGNYGTIGVAIAENGPLQWRLIYLAISCRVLGRGIERALLSRLVDDARHRGLESVEATFRDTGRNKMMRGMYQMMGFRQAPSSPDEPIILRANIDDIPAAPRWMEVLCESC